MHETAKVFATLHFACCLTKFIGLVKVRLRHDKGQPMVLFCVYKPVFCFSTDAGLLFLYNQGNSRGDGGDFQYITITYRWNLALSFVCFHIRLDKLSKIDGFGQFLFFGLSFKVAGYCGGDIKGKAGIAVAGNVI